MISEIDINTWKSEYTKSADPVPLYDAPRNSTITVCTMDCSDLPIHFSHIDGAYSYCWELTNPKNVIHIAASAPVFVWRKK